MNIQVEVCCGSYYDAMQAYLGGAKRIELNSALHMGGLTPSFGALQLTKQHTNLKVITMVRPRGAGFCYNKEDFDAMLIDAQRMLEQGADGIAFGCLRENGDIHVDQTRQLIQLIRQFDKEVIFHRAFDCARDPFHAMEELISLGVQRVLTSGGKATALAGLAQLKALQQRYGKQIEILAGSGIHAGNALAFVRDSGIKQIHSSCKAWLHDPTTTMQHVSYSYASLEHKNDYDVVDQKRVKELIESVQGNNHHFK